MPKLPSLKQAKALLESITSAEQAVKLVGPEREAYLKALEAVHGPKEARAAAMGFGKKDFYHGTPSQAQMDLIDPKLGKNNTLGPGRDLGTFYSDNPAVASEYAGDAGQVLPVKINRKGTNSYTLEGGEFGFDDAQTAADALQTSKNVTFPNDKGVPDYSKGLSGTTVLVGDPSSVRSTNAAFDPRFKDSKKIMAGAAGAGVLAASAGGNNQAEAGVVPNPKVFKIGKELVEARNIGEALGIKRMLEAQGKVSPHATVVEHVGEGIKDFGKVEIKDAPKQALGKVTAMPAVAAMGSPIEALRDLGKSWQSSVVDPIAGALKGTLTPGLNVQGQNFQTASPVSNMMLETAADPVNYLPGATGAVLGAAEMASQYAEGGEVESAPQFLTDEQMAAAQPQAAKPPGATLASAKAPPPDFISDDEFVSDEDKYGTLGQMAITGAEGLAEGVAGPLATLAETKLLGVPEADILARREENPITRGVGQAAGITGSVLGGVGLGSVMAKAGVGAAKAVGLGAAETLGARVGSEVVSQAVEGAVLAGADEASKMILKDPDQSAESAIANVGLNAALGGAGGALFAGAISPLWDATAGKAVGKLLTGLKGHLDGTVRPVVPEAIENAAKTLGIEPDGVLKAAMAGDPKAIEMFNTLRYAQNKEVHAAVQKLETETSQSVMNSLGVPLEDAQVYSKAEAGDKLFDAFKKEYDAKYAPVEAAMERRNAEASMISVPDDARLDQYGKILTKGMNEFGTDSPMYKLYDSWAERLLAKDSIGGIDKLKTELGNDISMAYRAGDTNRVQALTSIRNDFADFQENQIVKMARGTEKAGIEGAEAAGEALLNDRAEANRIYREFAQMSSALLDHTGTGNFKGAGTLLKKLEAVGPEGLLKKFSVKGNADFIPFLEQHFPEVMQQVRKQELLDLIQPAINRAKGESPVDINALDKILTKTMAGRKELAEFALSPEAIAKIQAASTLMDSVPKIRDSGTPGGLAKLLNKVPQSAMAAVAMITGHNPVFGYLGGEMAHQLGRNAPDAVRLGYLKFLGSDKPINAAGFKAMVDFMQAAAKGENALTNAAKNVFKAGAQVIPQNAFPVKADNDKLDKRVTRVMERPEELMRTAEGSPVGHYMEEHQTALTASTTRAVQYLASIKPQPHKLGPLDQPVPPTSAEEARYQRALSIANNPIIVLDHVKHGTIQKSDIKDLNGMFPSMYKQMVGKLTKEMTGAFAKKQVIPYKTKIGAALFMGTPVDATMTPQAIMAAQPQADQPPSMGGQGASKHGSPSKLGQKTNKMYLTPGQAAEADRSSRK